MEFKSWKEFSHHRLWSRPTLQSVEFKSWKEFWHHRPWSRPTLQSVEFKSWKEFSHHRPWSRPTLQSVEFKSWKEFSHHRPRLLSTRCGWRVSGGSSAHHGQLRRLSWVDGVRRATWRRCVEVLTVTLVLQQSSAQCPAFLHRTGAEMLHLMINFTEPGHFVLLMCSSWQKTNASQVQVKNQLTRHCAHVWEAFTWSGRPRQTLGLFANCRPRIHYITLKFFLKVALVETSRTTGHNKL